MHWLSQHWLEVLPWALYGLSEIMPLLPNKAASVIGAVLNIGKAVLRIKGKPMPAIVSNEEEPK